MLEDKLLIWKINRGNHNVLRGIYEKYKDDLVTLAAKLRDSSNTQAHRLLSGKAHRKRNLGNDKGVAK